jgi:hypothetical protein
MGAHNLDALAPEFNGEFLQRHLSMVVIKEI